jgi:hypothetical protein
MCEPGYFCSLGATVMSPVEEATYVGAIADYTDLVNQGPCPVGHYCPQGTAYPIPCKAGYY